MDGCCELRMMATTIVSLLFVDFIVVIFFSCLCYWLLVIVIGPVYLCIHIIITLGPLRLHRGGCLELYYCNMVEWCWWDSFTSVL